MPRLNSEMLPVSSVAAPTIINGYPRRVPRLTHECPECGRVFDLGDSVDADELAYGHDCEAVS